MPLSFWVEGPYPLTHSTIAAKVISGVPGMYILAPVLNNQALRVGRSDTNTNGRLKAYLGNYSYGQFWFLYAQSPDEAYQMECKAYHELRPPHNIIHPDAPTGSFVTCHVCTSLAPILGLR